MRRSILLSAVAALSISTINAQADQLAQVDVWETEVVSSSINLGKESIATKQADHLSDLLRDIPGVDVGGTHSINNRINIRGLQDDDLDITIDGAKVQNANMFHHIGNMLINPDILKKANIQVGTNSVINGSLGGSVAFETKDGREMLEKGKDFGARISSSYNSNKSLSGSITAYGNASEDLNFLVYHNYLDRGNWQYPSGEDTYGIKGKNQNTLLKASYDINDNQSISLSYDKLKDEGDYLPRPNFSSTANTTISGGEVTFPTEYTRNTITLKHKLDLGEKILLDTTVYSNTNELKRHETWVGRSPRPTFSGELKGEVKTLGLNSKAQSNIDVGNTLHTLTYGGIYDKQSSDVTWAGSAYGEKEEAKSSALFIEDAIDFDNGLVLTPGIRFNHYDFDGAYGKIKDNKFTYGLAAEYLISDNLTLLASATTLYKGVEMVDVLDSSRTVSTEVKSLKAETGINKEIGFRYIKDNVLGADNIGLSVKYFRTNIKDTIVTNWANVSGTWYATKANNGDLDLDGVEASFKYELGDFSSLLTYAHSNSNFTATNKSTNYEPGDSLSLNLNYQVTPNINTSWNSIFVKKEKDIGSINGIENKPGYSVHNMAVNYTPETIKNLSVIAGVDNIFNKEFISHASSTGSGRGAFFGDYEAGRNMKLTLSYKF
ncbi:TonB-dependent receptor domain-containing protein [Poseidonibacter lekithochrous]|uniref:TonB-dependent receptor domain-containing protein n=1 Tax=Poseidonibacter lekithochrous TaxID=1904463 RepID=UPI0008FC6D6B|nr:TonB-dependent receptor [Poseidonibacter lekithochrous]QKJ22547.1 TonB-dependent receptor [Poseidonibacter lekithochrous]